MATAVKNEKVIETVTNVTLSLSLEEAQDLLRVIGDESGRPVHELRFYSESGAIYEVLAALEEVL